MAVVNGHAVAGGLAFALAHDFRIMHTDAKIGLSEIKNGYPILGSYLALIKATVPIYTLRELIFGESMSTLSAKKHQIV